MGIISLIVVIFNIILLVGIDIFLWVLEPGYGLGGIFSIIIWFITYAVTEEIALAPRDFWVNSALDIVKKKIERAWLVTVVTGAFTLILGYFIFNRQDITLFSSLIIINLTLPSSIINGQKGQVAIFRCQTAAFFEKGVIFAMYSYEIDIAQHSSRRSGRSFRGYASLRDVVAVREHQLVLQPRHLHRQHHRFICNGTACQLLQRESRPSDGYGRRLRRVYDIQHLFSSERHSSSKRTVRFRLTLHLGDRPPVHRLRLPRLLCRRKTEIKNRHRPPLEFLPGLGPFATLCAVRRFVSLQILSMLAMKAISAVLVIISLGLQAAQRHDIDIVLAPPVGVFSDGGQYHL